MVNKICLNCYNININGTFSCVCDESVELTDEILLEILEKAFVKLKKSIEFANSIQKEEGKLKPLMKRLSVLETIETKGLDVKKIFNSIFYGLERATKIDPFSKSRAKSYLSAQKSIAMAKIKNDRDGFFAQLAKKLENYEDNIDPNLPYELGGDE